MEFYRRIHICNFLLHPFNVQPAMLVDRYFSYIFDKMPTYIAIEAFNLNLNNDRLSTNNGTTTHHQLFI